MTIATLADIREKVRRLTGSANDNLLTEARIDDYIDSFYLHDLPAEFRSLNLKDVLTFNTQRGVATYPLADPPFQSTSYPNGLVDFITTIEPPVYLAKRQIGLYYDAREFYASTGSDQFSQVLTTGDGTAGAYTGTLTALPVVPSVSNDPAILGYPAGQMQNVLITANTSFGSTQNVSDIPTAGGATGTLTGDGTGTINYATGAITVTFNGAVPSGEDIEVQYSSHTLSRPVSILYQKNELTLSPSPDKGYTVELTVYRQPTQVLADTAAGAGTPELNEWWELIAAGAAKKVFEDRSDDDGIALMLHMINERYHVAESRTYAQLGSQRVPTVFASQTADGAGSDSNYLWGE